MKVVCISGPRPFFARIMDRLGVKPPTVGETYTVRGKVEADSSGGPRTFLLLNEIRSRIVRYPRGMRAEAGFPKEWFREVTETSTTTDISTWIGGADPASEQFDNRRKQREYVESHNDGAYTWASKRGAAAWATGRGEW